MSKSHKTMETLTPMAMNDDPDLRFAVGVAHVPDL